jgi:RNA polymerase sigma factor (TIGR02999 family)
MSADAMDVTTLLRRWSDGDKAALDDLMPRVYGELRRIASERMRRENPGHLLESAALVNEAFLKLVDQRGIQWQNRAHFFAVAAQSIRRILVDHARTEKRGGAARTLVLDVCRFRTKRTSRSWRLTMPWYRSKNSLPNRAAWWSCGFLAD